MGHTGGYRFLQRCNGSRTILRMHMREEFIDRLCTVLRCDYQQRMALRGPDDLARPQVGLPDRQGAGIGDDLESLLQGIGAIWAVVYFMHGKGSPGEALTS